jgi:hypothetical protein
MIGKFTPIFTAAFLMCMVFGVSAAVAAEERRLPPCPKDQNLYYHRCVGTYRFPDGDTYVGPFKDNDYDGYGTYTFANGDRYDGDFKRGVFEGLGVFTFTDGYQLKGRFRNNRFVGYASDLKV